MSNDIAATVGLTVEGFLMMDICPVKGLGSDACVVGHTSIGVEHVLCGKDVAIDRCATEEPPVVVGGTGVFIVANITLNGDITAGSSAIACSPFASNEFIGPYWDVWLETWEFDLVASSGGTRYDGDLTDFVSVEISGLPTPSDQSYAPHDKVSGAGAQSGWNVAGLKGRWQAQGGAKAATSNPLVNDTYYEALTVTAEGFGDTFVAGDPLCSGTAFSPSPHLSYPCTGVHGVDDPLHTNASAYSPQAIDFSGVSLVSDGINYLPLGILAFSSNNNDNSTFTPDVGYVAVLFESQDLIMRTVVAESGSFAITGSSVALVYSGSAVDSLFIDADFTTSTYEVNGDAVTIDDIFDGTTDPGDFSASGLAPWEANATRLKLQTAILNSIFLLLDEGVTIVTEIDFNGTQDSGPVFIWGDSTDPDAASWLLYEDANNSIASDRVRFSISDYDTLADDADLTPNSTGIVRLGFTVGRPDSGSYATDYNYMGGIAGSLTATSYNAKEMLPSLDFAEIFGSDTWSWFWSTAYIRKLQIYVGALEPADLAIAAASGLTLSISGTPVEATSTRFAYEGFTAVAAGGLPPYTFTVQTGSLPTGLTLDGSTGVVSGTATTPGSETGIVIRVTDDNGDTADLASFDIVVTDQWAIMAGRDQINNGGSGTITFTGMDLGPADADRVLAIMISSGNGNVHNVNTVTVAGNSATLKVRNTGSVHEAAIYALALPSGTSGTVVITITGTVFNINLACSIIAMYGVSATTNDTDTDIHGSATTTYSDSVNTLADGISVGVIGIDAFNGSVSWSGLVETAEFTQLTDQTHSVAFAMDTASTTRSVTVTTTNAAGVMVLATFSP